MAKFPKTVAAVQKRDRCMWEIGDALIAECGKPSQDGVNDGSLKKLEQASTELERLQITDYSVSTLTRIRQVAAAFSRVARRASLSWEAHKAAGSPEMFDAVIKATPKERPVTRDHVRAMKPLVEKEQRRQAERAPDAPETDRDVPVATDEPFYLADIATASVQLKAAKKDLKAAQKSLAPWIGKIEPDLLDHLVEDALALATESRTFADEMRKAIKNKRGDLRLVGA